MANGQLNIGAGVGEASVWNPNQMVQNFGNILARQQAKRQQEQQLLASELAKVKTDGLRNDADRKVFFDRYSNIKSLASQIPYEKNNWKKTQLKAQVDQGLLELQDYAVRSKQQGANELAWTKSYMSNPEHWGDDALKAAQKSKQLALTDNGVINDFTTLQRQPNIDKINKDLSLAVAANLKGQGWQTIQQKATQGNKTGVNVLNQRAVNPEEVLVTTGMYYDSHPDMQRLMQIQYPEIYANNDPKTAKALALSQYIDTGLKSQAFGPISESKPREFRADWRPDTYYAHLAAREAAKAGSSSDLTPAQTLITQMQTQVPGSGEKLISLAPVAQYAGKKPVIKIDQNTGEHVFEFPAQISGKDKDAINFNEKLRAQYEKNPEKKGGVFGIGGTKIPFEQSTKFKELKPEEVIKRPAQSYKLNPASPDYLAKAAEMAKEQNINLPQLNTTESKKGGRGQIDAAVKAPEKVREVKKESSPKTVRVTLNGQEGEIPLDKYIEFKKKYPKAQRIN